MQNIQLICLGKLNMAFCAQGVAEYSKRLGAFCRFTVTELPEETVKDKTASAASIEAALQKEADAILSKVKKGSVLVALCVEGKSISSEELAEYIQSKAVGGEGDIAFVIGSSHGLAQKVKQAADLKFSMGRITLPHQLARVVLCEQIYRAFTILNGVKYHK